MEKRKIIMSNNFNWNRKKNISKDEYLKLITDKEKAYEQACDIRKFEIELYWKRTIYFWGFITVIYTAYYKVFSEFYYIKNTDIMSLSFHGSIPLIIISGLGLIFSLSWLLSNYASKHWQENWEHHIELLEPYITGDLYKIYEAQNSFSVTKINLSCSYAISTASLILFGYECFALVAKFNISNRQRVFICIIFVALMILFISLYMIFNQGNSDSKGSFKFDYMNLE